MTAAPSAAGAATSWRVRLTSGAAFRMESLFVLAILVVVMATLSPYFLSVSNFLNILLATATIGVLAIGATFVISSAGIDLSVGSVLGFSGVAGCLLMSSWGLPWPLGILACIGAGALAGFVNGLLITRVRVPPLIMTIATLALYGGSPKA